MAEPSEDITTVPGPDFVSVEGVELATWEAGHGPVALMIHGSAAATWGPVFGDPGTGCRTVAYDRRSFGNSPHPPLADTSRHAQDAAGLLKALDAGPAVVLGWSIGGVIALELAARHPALVRGLVLIEPPLHAKRHPNPRLIWALAGVKPVRRLRGDRAAAERFLRWALSGPAAASGLDAIPPEARESWLANSAAIVRELDAGTGEELQRRELNSISCPAICLLGDQSNRTFAAAARRVASRVPGCELRAVPGAGHAMQFDRPNAIVAAIRDVAAA